MKKKLPEHIDELISEMGMTEKNFKGVDKKKLQAALASKKKIIDNNETVKK